MTQDVAGGGPAGPPPDSIKAIPVRHYGRWVGAAVVLYLAIALVKTLAANEHFRFGEVPNYFSDGTILDGLRTTILLTVVCQTIGVVLGTVFAVMRLSKNPVLSTASWLYIWFFRGTPVLVQLIFWFNLALIFPDLTLGLPLTGLSIASYDTNTVVTPFVAAVLGLGLNEGAYMAEIVRAGIIAVDEGQTEAAQALGMRSGQTMRRIVLPQAMRVIIPPTGNEFISMLKTTSLVSVIAANDLLTRAQNIYSRNFLVLELLVVASIWYLVLTSIASVGQYYLERRFARGASRDLPDTPFMRIRRNLRLGRVHS